MYTVNLSHLQAVSRAKYFVNSGISKNMTPKLITKIERDVELLDEIHAYISQQIMEPGLPISPVSNGQVKDEEKDGTKNSSTTL